MVHDDWSQSRTIFLPQLGKNSLVNERPILFSFPAVAKMEDVHVYI